MAARRKSVPLRVAAATTGRGPILPSAPAAASPAAASSARPTAKAGDVADRPISPKDLLATMYHLLGIDPHNTLHDRTGRPLPLVDGQVIADAFA